MLPRLYKRLIQLGKISGAVSFLIAAPYALVQYWEARGNARVEQTLNFYKSYNAKPFIDYREKTTKAVLKFKQQFLDASVDEKRLLEVQLKMISSEDIEMELMLLFDFFDGVSVCVTSNLCDDGAALQLFKPRAAEIYLLFYQFMEYQRGTSASREFGLGLEAIAKAGFASNGEKIRKFRLVKNQK